MKLNGNCYNYFTVRTKYRAKLKTYLSDNLIQSTVYYPLSLHLQPVFKGLKQFGLFNSEKAQSEVISLPMYPELSDKEVKLICDHINKILDKQITV
jgi:dTDP-4-amino-4,6-dideoxygalactose transaminase